MGGVDENGNLERSSILKGMRNSLSPSRCRSSYRARVFGLLKTIAAEAGADSSIPCAE
jgi:hypothetical protein